MFDFLVLPVTVLSCFVSDLTLVCKLLSRRPELLLFVFDSPLCHLIFYPTGDFVLRDVL